MQVKQRIRPFCCSLSSRHGSIFSASLHPTPPPPIQPFSQPPQGLLVRIPFFLQRRRRGGQELGLRGASLPLPRSPHHPPNCRLYRHLVQAPPLLPPPLPFSPPLQALLLQLTTSARSLVSGSDISEADPLTDCAFGSTEQAQLVADQNGDNSVSDLGSEPDPVLNKTEIESICNVLEELPPNCRMELVLTKCGICPTQSVVVSVIDRFRHSHKPAYRFFRWAGSMPGFAHDQVTYNKMLDVLGRNCQFGTLVDLLEEMGSLQLLSMESFKIPIHSFASLQEIKRCLWVFSSWRELGLMLV